MPPHAVGPYRPLGLALNIVSSPDLFVIWSLRPLLSNLLHLYERKAKLHHLD